MAEMFLYQVTPSVTSGNPNRRSLNVQAAWKYRFKTRFRYIKMKS